MTIISITPVTSKTQSTLLFIDTHLNTDSCQNTYTKEFFHYYLRAYLLCSAFSTAGARLDRIHSANQVMLEMLVILTAHCCGNKVKLLLLLGHCRKATQLIACHYKGFKQAPTNSKEMQTMFLLMIQNHQSKYSVWKKQSVSIPGDKKGVFLFWLCKVTSNVQGTGGNDPLWDHSLKSWSRKTE